MAKYLSPTNGAQSTTATKAASSAAKSSTVSEALDQELGKDDFLNLLVLQMQNQDPTDPLDNEDLLSQLAQFSSLEQMNNLNEGFETFAGNLDQLNFMTAGSLIGHRVSGVDVDGQSVVGNVDRVHLDGSIVYLTVGEQLVSMANVLAIDAPSQDGQ